MSHIPDYRDEVSESSKNYCSVVDNYKTFQRSDHSQGNREINFGGNSSFKSSKGTNLLPKAHTKCLPKLVDRLRKAPNLFDT